MNRILAVARNMIAEGIRMKIAVIFIVMLVVMVAALPAIMHGDGTLKGRVQTFLAYSLGATAVLLSLLTVFLSCASVATELAGRQIFLTVSKPIARWQYLVGKWLGIVILDAMLLAGAAVGIYAMVAYLKTTAWLNEQDRDALRYEVLTARASVRPSAPDFAALADVRMERLKQEGRLPQSAFAATGGWSRVGQTIRQRIGDELSKQWLSCPPLDVREFRFENMQFDPNESGVIHLRYKAQVSRFPPDEMLRCAWVIGDPTKEGTRISRPYLSPRADVVRRYHIVRIPADAIAPDGTLLVRFENVDWRYPGDPERMHRTSVSFSGQGDLEVLYEVGGFEANYLRSLLMVLAQLVLLAAVGVLASSFLSFPVACLMCMMVYLTAISSGFLQEAVRELAANPAAFEGDLALRLAVLLKPATTVFLWLVPRISAYNPISDLVDGRLVSWAWLGQAALWLGAVQTAIAMAAACLIFRRRELAQVIV